MPRYSEHQARDAIASSHSYAEALRKLGLQPAGGNHRLFRDYVDNVWRIPTDHFDPHRQFREAQRKSQPAKPLEEVLVQGSTYNRHQLKMRLYKEGLKQPVCEMCDQGDVWRGQYLSLVLDHVNGVGDDNRLENLRILCPNCAATLDTHCGRKNKAGPTMKPCHMCGEMFVVWHPRNVFCSKECGVSGAAGMNSLRLWGRPNPDRRRVERPALEQLLDEVRRMGWSAVGRKYGVSDNAIRKWVRQYYNEMERAELDARGLEDPSHA